MECNSFHGPQLIRAFKLARVQLTCLIVWKGRLKKTKAWISTINFKYQLMETWAPGVEHSAVMSRSPLQRRNGELSIDVAKFRKVSSQLYSPQCMLRDV